jgi:tRNA(fMet)-specific endonuclease VapC
MDAILLDTTVASMLHPRKKGHPLRARYETHMAGKILALSFQSVAELWSWAVERNWGDRQKAGMENLLRKFLVIPYDFELAKVWANINAQCKKQGRRLEAGDAWIVATAVHRRIPLLTHDLDHVGLALEGLIVISYAADNQSQPPDY